VSAGAGQPVAGAARVARLATLACVGLFSIAMLAACVCYPGGSWTLPSSDGFSLLRNFWCDLLRSRAINGADNALGKQLAGVGFAALGLGLWPFWWVASTLLERRSRWLVWRLGAASAAALIAMALLPSDRHPLAHGVVALAGGLLGAAAAALCVHARLPGESRLSFRRWSGALTLSLSLAHVALYVNVAYLGGAESVTHPAVQKLATLSLLLWVLGTVARARSAPDTLTLAKHRARTSAV